MRKLPEIPLGTIDRLIRKAGVQRTSIKATKALRDAIEHIIITIAKKSGECAQHGGRVTLTESDVKLALNLLDIKKA